jgi:AcrR family transcriptional regulator
MKTVERILIAALNLLNDQGVARVSTNAIADAADLSVGNLYYHFKNKDEILLALFKDFQSAVAPLLIQENEIQSMEQWAHWWHDWFDHVQCFQFLFHDQSYLFHSNEHIRFHYDQLVNKVEKQQLSLFGQLKRQGTLVATEQDLDRIAREVTFIAVFWQDFYELGRPKPHRSNSAFKSALGQIMGLLLPYMKAVDQLQMEQLIEHAS